MSADQAKISATATAPNGAKKGTARVVGGGPAALPKEATGGGGLVAFLLVLVVLQALGFGAYFFRAQIAAAFGVGKVAATQPARAVAVVAATARRGDLPMYVTGLGTVTAYYSVTVRTRVDGQLDKILYVEGQDVKAGDALAEIDPRPYQVQLDQALGQMAKDQATLDNARVDLKRMQDAGDAVSDQQLKTALAAVAQDEGVLKSDQAAIDNAKLNLTYCKIMAPITGTMGLRPVDEGNMVHATDANGLAVINVFEPIAIKFPVAEDALPRVQKAMAGGQAMVAEAYNRDLTMKLATGKLEAVDNQIDPTSGTVQLKARFENPAPHLLFPNQFVNVWLLVEVRKDVVLVPSPAVQHSPAGAFAYVVKGDNTVEMRTVVEGPTGKASPTAREFTSIREGLEAGDVVVTDGVDKLQPKTLVRVSAETGTQPGTTQPRTKAGGTRPAESEPAGRGGR